MTQTLTKSINIDYLHKVNQLLPNAKVIKLKGYSSKNLNRDYSLAKHPVGKWQDPKPLSENEIQSWLAVGGWIGATLPEERFIIDIDDPSDGQLLKNLLEGENIHHHCIKTVRGWQFIFKALDQKTLAVKQISHYWSSIGIKVDTKPPGKGYIVFPTSNTEGREIATISITEPDELPDYLHPIWNATKSKDPVTKQIYEFPLPMDGSGSRNNELFEFARRVWSVKGDASLLNTAIPLIYQYFISDKQDFEFSEVERILQSVTGMEQQKQEFKIAYTESDLPVSHSTSIPAPYSVKAGTLWKVDFKKVDGILQEIPKMVCRHSPIITRSFSNVERSQLYYEVEWTDQGRVYKETVTAGSLAIKKDLLQLAEMSLGVNDLNAKDLIDYFDKYITQNSIPRDYLVERLGHIKNGFVHPLTVSNTKIMPADIGEKQMMEAFSASGTSEEWIEEVFEPIKDHPKAVLLVLASFASVILKDLKLKPFIVDLSGVTSQGKTTALRVAGSVWGNEYMVAEWNLTKTAAERKAAFLNSFPLLLDDTRKANEKDLQAFVYNFSGGRSKGRGSIGGSQQEFTWNNLMLSTGEDSLNSYAERAGGVAARILPITGLPFEGEEYAFFNKIYSAIEKNYGSIGVEFLEKWEDKKEILLPYYQEYNDLFQKKAKGNDVVARIARYYAAIIYTGRLLNEFFQIEIDIKELIHLFDDINAENSSTDKPMQLLEAMLSDLDADRGSVFGQFIPQRDIKAVYRHGTLYLMPNYLKDFLKSEQGTIRSEWLRREITIERINDGKSVDYQQIKHGGKKFRGVAIQPDMVSSLGFDFEEGSNS